MRKWIVRLIGISFLFGAVTAYLDLITKKNPYYGFLGFSFSFVSGPSPESMTSQLDITALIGLWVNLYIGYQLLKSKNQGRIWALVILWITALSSLVGLVVLYFNNHISPLASISLTSNYLNYSFKSPLLAIIGSTFIFYVIQIYFLMRKDIKALFQKTDEIVERTS